MKPALTFAIPCRDGERHLPALLESLLGQTQPCQLILVDDASRDRSVAVAREVAGERLTVIENADPKGLPGNWNRAAAAADTEFFCLAHQDDVYAPEFGATLVAALAEAPRAAAAHCLARAIDDAGRPLASLSERYKARFWRNLPRVESRADGFGRLYAGNYVNCASLVYRGAAFAAVGCFDTHLRFAPDWEWLLRAFAKDWQLVAVPQPLVAYRRHGGQASRAAATSMQRYREEHALLATARSLGVGEGLLAASARSTAMRDNLLYDAFTDLQAGDASAARQKLDLLAQLDPTSRRSLPARALAGSMRLGWPGRKAMALALSSYVGWKGR